MKSKNRPTGYRQPAGDYYPADLNAKKQLQMRDEDETIDFHKVVDDEEEGEDKNNWVIE